MLRIVTRLFCFVLFSLFLPAAWAQYGAGIQGVVQDKSGAVVPGAKVTVTEQSTGVTHDSLTSASGFYSVPGLTPGLYTVSVEATSFRTETISHVAVSAESTRGLNIELTPGPNRESVTVNGDTDVLETENANVSGGISSRQVQELHSFGRDPYELLRLAPGVFGDAARGSDSKATFFPNGVGVGGSANSIYQVENQPQISSNGQRVTENNFMIDGVDASITHC